MAIDLRGEACREAMTGWVISRNSAFDIADSVSSFATDFPRASMRLCYDERLLEGREGAMGGGRARPPV